MSFKDKVGAMDGVEEVPSSNPSMRKPTFGAKLKVHLRKWWWAHLIAFIALILILVLCLLYAVFPKVAQDKINQSTLVVNSLVLSNPTATSFHLFQNSTVGNPTEYHPRLDAFNATLALDGGEPYAKIELPELIASRYAVTIVDQDVTITNQDGFSAYNEAVLNQEEVKVDVKGRTGLHEMKFPTAQVDYDATATMKGLNKLNGFNVTSFEIKLAPEPDGTNMIGEVLIPNPTVMTLTMGNLTFNNLLPATANTPATPIGISTLSNVVLTPGNNTIPMRSQVNQTLVIGAISTIYKDGMLPVDIVGNSSVYEGVHLPYFERALRGLTQHVVLNVGAALQEIGLDAGALAALGGSGGGDGERRTPPS